MFSYTAKDMYLKTRRFARMKIKVLTILLIFVLSQKATGALVEDLDISFNSTEVYATFSFSLNQGELETLKRGGQKEIIFYIDLFRRWEIFPDEFITGLKVVRVLYVDPMKKEFTATSFDGNTLIEKRFKGLESMLKWAFTFKEVKVADLKGLPEGIYFVKVTAESKTKKIPSIITDLLIFLPSREFRVSLHSPPFKWDKNEIRVMK